MGLFGFWVARELGGGGGMVAGVVAGSYGVILVGVGVAGVGGRLLQTSMSGGFATLGPPHLGHAH